MNYKNLNLILVISLLMNILGMMFYDNNYL